MCGISADLTAKYQELVGKGVKIYWWMINSCTTNLTTVADKFSGNNCTLFTISCKSGKEISYYSALGDEDEVILAPGTRFVVTGEAPQKRVVELEENPVTALINLQSAMNSICLMPLSLLAKKCLKQKETKQKKKD